MFSVITNIYNKKNQRTYLNGIVHSHGKTEKAYFLQLETFDVCTTGDTEQIDTIFKFLPQTRQHECIDILHCCNGPCLQVGEVTRQWYFAWNARRTITTDLLVWYSNIKNDFSPGAAIF